LSIRIDKKKIYEYLIIGSTKKRLIKLKWILNANTFLLIHSFKNVSVKIHKNSFIHLTLSSSSCFLINTFFGRGWITTRAHVYFFVRIFKTCEYCIGDLSDFFCAREKNRKIESRIGIIGIMEIILSQSWNTRLSPEPWRTSFY
jgi:hypothetical protein